MRREQRAVVYCEWSVPGKYFGVCIVVSTAPYLWSDYGGVRSVNTNLEQCDTIESVKEREQIVLIIRVAGHFSQVWPVIVNSLVSL